MSTPCQRLASRTPRKAVINDNQPRPAMADDIREYSQALAWRDGDERLWPFASPRAPRMASRQTPHRQCRDSHRGNPASGKERDEGPSINCEAVKVRQDRVKSPADRAGGRSQRHEGIGRRLKRGRQCDRDTVAHPGEDLPDADQREFRPAHGGNGIGVEHRPKGLRLCPEPGHFRAAVLQQRDKSCRVRRHGLEIEGHLLLADARALEAVDIELQRFPALMSQSGLPCQRWHS